VTVLRSGSATDVGRVRSSNQDLSLESANLYAVADGMGGHAGGEVAAQVAVDALRSSFAHHVSLDGLRQAVTEANAAVWRQSQQQAELRGMGTTMTAAALVPGSDGRDVIALANVGDSRAYVFSAGRITQVTADHSLAEEKVRHGELTEAEAAVHPHRHILTRALGVAAGVEVDLWELHLQAGDRIVLCSDGLTNEVDPAGIAGVLAEVADPTEAARRLVAMANEHGGNDNITVVVVDVLVDHDAAAPGAGAIGAALAGAPDAGAGITGPPVAPPAPAVGGAPGAGSELAAGAPGTAAGPATADLTGMVPARGQAGVLAGTAVDARRPPPAGPAEAEAGTEEGERKPGRKERRRQRRLAGIPRRVTFRVLLFAVLLAVVVAAAYVFVRWYATDNWFVTVKGDHVVIYQGRPGGFLWFQPTLVQRTDVTTAEVLPFRMDALEADKQEPSLAQARGYVANLRQEYQSQQRIANGQGTGSASASTSTTTTAPPAPAGTASTSPTTTVTAPATAPGA
jgi:serine/threonine protein phosphatase PrpC